MKLPAVDGFLFQYQFKNAAMSIKTLQKRLSHPQNWIMILFEYIFVLLMKSQQKEKKQGMLFDPYPKFRSISQTFSIKGRINGNKCGFGSKFGIEKFNQNPIDTHSYSPQAMERGRCAQIKTNTHIDCQLDFRFFSILFLVFVLCVGSIFILSIRSLFLLAKSLLVKQWQAVGMKM